MTYSREFLTRKIKNNSREVLKLQNQIQSYEEQNAKYRRLLMDLEEYERNISLDKRTLKKYITSKVKTIELMNQCC